MPDISNMLPSTEFLQELLIAAGIVVLFAIGARLALYFLSTIVSRLTRNTNTKLDDMIVRSLKAPVFIIIVLLGFTVGLAQMTLTPEWSQFTNGSLFIGYTLTVALIIYRVIRDLLDWYLHEKSKATETTLDEMLIPFVRRLLAIVLFGIAFVMIMQYFAIEVTGLVATLGVGSLAVALAAQAVLGDLIAGFFVLLDQRYRIGDRIELIDEGVIGDVMDIGLRTTRILTMDHRVVIVPNSIITNRLVINHAFPDPKLRVDLPIGVAYGSDIAKVKRVMIEAMQNVEGVYRDRKPDVVMRGFGESALDLEMRCWINAFGDRPKMVDRINVAVYNALNEAGIEIPFPQRVLYHRVNAIDIEPIRSAFTEQNGADPPEAPKALPPADGQREMRNEK
jgi:MscS family membrane protein